MSGFLLRGVGAGILVGAILALASGSQNQKRGEPCFRDCYEEQPKSGVVHLTVKALLDEELGREVDFQVFVDTSLDVRERHYSEYLYNVDYLKYAFRYSIKVKKEDILECFENPKYDIYLLNQVQIDRYFRIRVEINCGVIN